MRPLTPYLMFNGNAREAMEFYKSCFGGQLEIMTYADAPADSCADNSKPTEKTKDKVMHACLTSGDFMLMASDDPISVPVTTSNISISIHPQDIPETQKLFKALSAGGEVTMELADTFWGAHFGTLKDKFGINWMLNCQLQDQKETKNTKEKMAYVDGFVLPVPEGKLEAYCEMAEKAGKIWMEHGALLYKECVLEDGNPQMPEDAPETCKITPFPDLAKVKSGETVIFAFIVYESREHRDEVNKKVMSDPRMNEACDVNNMPFDPSRMTYGGFKAIVDL